MRDLALTYHVSVAWYILERESVLQEHDNEQKSGGSLERRRICDRDHAARSRYQDSRGRVRRAGGIAGRCAAAHLRLCDQLRRHRGLLACTPSVIAVS